MTASTPNGSKVYAVGGDLHHTDITEAVQFMYDTVIMSLDWGSGFLSHEEEHLVEKVGGTLGFDPPTMQCRARREKRHSGAGRTYMETIDYKGPCSGGYDDV